ncbi:MAG TPA: hypothetical protein VFG04_14550 [Planctomycetaceae bacterium]|nr:hypothetical protein [Planctomycetaceae bacterium]
MLEPDPEFLRAWKTTRPAKLEHAFSLKHAESYHHWRAPRSSQGAWRGGAKDGRDFGDEMDVVRRRCEPTAGMRVSILMRHCRNTDAGPPAGSARLTTAKVLAPEDVRVGDYVALLHVVREMPSFWWCEGISTIRMDEPVRVAFVPNNGGMPFQVRSVCLPFILVKTPSGDLRNLDVRRYGLARLDRAHALAAWKASKKKGRKRERV